MSALGNLVVSVTMDTLEFTKGIDKNTHEARKFAENLDRTINRSVKSATDGFKGFALGALGAVGAVTTVSAAIGKLNNTFIQLDKAAKDSQRFGIPIEQLTALQFAAGLSGASVDKLGDALKDMLKNASEASNGTKGQADLFRSLGVAVTDAGGRVRSTSDLIGDLAEVFSGLDDGATKTNLAMKVFGESGKELIPMLNQGRSGIAALTDEAERSGYVMGSEAAKAAETYNDNMERLNKSVDSLFVSMANSLLPGLNDITEALRDATSSAGSLGEGLQIIFNEAVNSGSPAQRLQDLNEELIQARQNLEDYQGVLGQFFAEKQLIAVENQIRYNQRLLDRQIDEAVKPPTTLPDGSETAVAKARREMEEREKREREDRIKQILAEGEASKVAAEAKKLQAAAEKEYSELMKQIGQQNKAYDDLVEYLNEHEKYLVAREAETQAMRDQLEEIGLTDRALAELRARRMRETAALKESTAAKEQDTFAAEKLRKEAEELRKQADISVEMFDRQQVVASAKTMAEEYKKVNEEITRSLTDALVRGFENGKGLAQSFGDYLENYFKTLVLRIAVQPVAQGIGAAVGGILMPGAAQASGFSGPAADPLTASLYSDPAGTIKGAYNAFTGGTSFLTANSAAEFGSLFGDFGFELTAQGGYLQDFGAAVFNNAETLGQLANAAGIAFTALSAFKALDEGKYFTAIGSGVGYALGGALGATLGNLVGGFVDKALGFGKPRGRNAFGTYDSRTGTNTGTTDFRHEADYDSAIADFGQSFEQRYRDMVKALGGVERDISTYIRIKTDVGGTSPSDAYFSTFLDGQAAASTGRGGIGRSMEELKAELENQALRNLIGVLQNTDFEDNLDRLFDSVNVVSDSMDRLNNVLEKANVIRFLNLNMNTFAVNVRQLANASIESLDALIAAAGGTDEFSKALNAYMASFATDSEKLAAAQRGLEAQFKQLNLSVPASTAELRKLIDAQDLTTEQGRETYLALIQLAESFKAIEASEKQVQAAIDETVNRTKAYIALLNGETKTALQSLAEQISSTTSALYDTTDPFERIALEGRLSDLVFQRYEAEIAMLGQVMVATQEVFSAIGDERVSINTARQQITGQGPLVMSAGQIREGIAAATELGSLPGGMGLQQANDRVAETQAQALEQQALIERLTGQSASFSDLMVQRQSEVDKQISLAKQAVGLFNSNNRAGSAFATNSGGGLAVAGFDDAAKKAALDYAYITYNVGREGDVSALRGQLNNGRSDLGGLSIVDAIFGSSQRIANAQQQLENVARQYANSTIEIAQAQARAVEIQQNLATAEIQRADAQEEFARQIQQYVIDAGKATGKLSKLREETVKYYEQQQALANLMIGSAQSIRNVVQQVRFNDLSASQQLAELQSQFTTAYASGLVSSGEALAGYGNTAAALIEPILQKAGEVFGTGGFDYEQLKGALLNQAETLASRIEGAAPKSYQQESLQLLDTIDVSLALIEEHTRSAEALIVDAINGSKSATVDALRQLLNALQGNPVQQFSTGGFVVGPGTSNSDSVRAFLSTGEYVMNANAVNRLGVDFMDQVNQGMIPMPRVPGLAQSRNMNNSELAMEIRQVGGAIARLERTVMIGDQQVAKNTGDISRVMKRIDEGDALRVREVV